uniref:Protein sevenless n=1 Tax=Ceratitis capitata TaxID=7213 RepID=W8B776_CERCA
MYWAQQMQMAKATLQQETPFIQILNDTDTGTDTIKLFWNISLPEHFYVNHQFSIHIQYKYEDIENITAPQSWRNLANFDCKRNFDCELFDELIPYAVYKVRRNVAIKCGEINL